jgi:autoinducer 2-degrading protein
MPYVLAVTVWAKEGRADDMARLMRMNAAASRLEPGCLVFDVHRSTEDLHRFLVYERFVDEDAFHAHHETEHFKRYAAAVDPLRERAEVHAYTTPDDG